MNGKIVVLALVFVVCGAGAWWLFSGSETDEERIKALFGKMAESCAKKSKESSIVMAMKNSDFSNFVANPCSVTIGEALVDGTFSPMEFAAQLTKGRVMFKSIYGELGDWNIKVASDGKSAVVEYSVRIRGETKQGGKFDESRDLRSELLKIDGKWKISSFEIKQVLEK